MDEELEMEIENKLAYMLAKCYIQIPWRKIGVKSAHKFFIDRIRASSTAPDIKTFLDVFTRRINVEFVQIDKEVLDFLTRENATAMSLIRKESTYLTNFALEIRDEVKSDEKLAKAGQTTL